MTDDADNGNRARNTQATEPDRLDAWLDDSGFVDVELDGWAGFVDDADLDDPWADAIIAVPRLTDAQLDYLTGNADEAPTPEDVARADDVIIEIPSDPNDITPFDS